MIVHTPGRPVQQRGFTLIEILVVFTLIAMLLTIAVPRYLNAVDDSKLKVREQNLATLRDALDKFKADQGQYPASLDDLVSKRYLRALPVDPISTSNQWTIVADPNGVYPGVYDVMPPQQMTPSAPVPQ
jgi:general secretion pathway protein G